MRLGEGPTAYLRGATYAAAFTLFVSRGTNNSPTRSRARLQCEKMGLILHVSRVEGRGKERAAVQAILLLCKVLSWLEALN